MDNIQELKKFGLLMAGIISLLFGLMIPYLGNHAFSLWPWTVSSVFLIISLVHPKLLAHVYKAWMKIGHLLGWVNTRTILAILFFGILTPIGLILRLLKKDPLMKNPDAKLETYRVLCKPIESSEFKRPF